MRPGPHPWASDDVWTIGPDVGSNTKIVPLDAHRDEGYYRTRRPGPDIFNWQQNRNALIQRFAAKMMASNFSLRDSAVLSAAHNIFASTHLQGSTAMDVLLYQGHPGVAANINEFVCYDGVKWGNLASNPIAAIPNSVNRMDADSDDIGGYRVVVVDDANGNDLVYRASGFAGGAWAACNVVGAPALDWISVGSDKRSAGGGTTKWLIGDGNLGGNAAVYASTTIGGADNFANVAGFPALGAVNAIRYIGHTCHPANALGPDDAGNPSWLILTDSQACVSADGVTWSNAAHGFGFTPNKKSAAYSRTAARWVVTRNGSRNIYYSDNNGVTWSTIANALPSTPAGATEIKCDDHGTFVISDGSASSATLVTTGYIWVSTDDGLTWSTVVLPPVVTANPTATFNSWALEVGKHSGNNWDSPGQHSTLFSVFYNDNATPLCETLRSLSY